MLDVDPAAGGEPSLTRVRNRLARDGFKLPRTLTAITGGGGRHYYYAAPAGATIGNSAGRLGPGLDVRGVGGYVVAPPSQHASGRRYTWVDIGVPLAPWPAALTRLLTRPAPERQGLAPREIVAANAYAAAAVRAELADVSNAPRGTRNHRLNRAAFKLGQLVAAGLVDEGAAVCNLLDAADALVVEDGEAAVRNTISSGLRAGKTRPRSQP